MSSVKSYLSPSDKSRISQELREIRARRRATSDVSSGDGQYYRPPEVNIDDGVLKAREDKLNRVLQNESAPIVSPTQKNAAYKEFNTLLREFEEKSLTKYDQGLGYPEIMKRTGADSEVSFKNATNKCLAWESASRGKYVSKRLKELASVIDPENPELRNLENFRRRK